MEMFEWITALAGAGSCGSKRGCAHPVGSFTPKVSTDLRCIACATRHHAFCLNSFR